MNEFAPNFVIRAYTSRFGEKKNQVYQALVLDVSFYVASKGASKYLL
jgi:hypothetical protein